MDSANKSGTDTHLGSEAQKIYQTLSKDFSKRDFGIVYKYLLENGK